MLLQDKKIYKSRIFIKKKIAQSLVNSICQNVIILGDFNFVENNLDRLRALRPYDIYLQKNTNLKI